MTHDGGPTSKGSPVIAWQCTGCGAKGNATQRPDRCFRCGAKRVVVVRMRSEGTTSKGGDAKGANVKGARFGVRFALDDD